MWEKEKRASEREREKQIRDVHASDTWRAEKIELFQSNLSEYLSIYRISTAHLLYHLSIACNVEFICVFMCVRLCVVHTSIKCLASAIHRFGFGART